MQISAGHGGAEMEDSTAFRDPDVMLSSTDAMKIT